MSLLKFTPKAVTKEIEVVNRSLEPYIRLKTDLVTGIGNQFGLIIPKLLDMSSYKQISFSCKVKYGKNKSGESYVVNRFTTSGRLFGVSLSSGVFNAGIVNAQGTNLYKYALPSTFSLDELTEITMSYDKATGIFDFYAGGTLVTSNNVGTVSITTWTPSFGLSMANDACLRSGDVVDVSSISLTGDGQELL